MSNSFYLCVCMCVCMWVSTVDSVLTKSIANKSDEIVDMVYTVQCTSFAPQLHRLSDFCVCVFSGSPTSFPLSLSLSVFSIQFIIAFAVNLTGNFSTLYQISISKFYLLSIFEFFALFFAIPALSLYHSLYPPIPEHMKLCCCHFSLEHQLVVSKYENKLFYCITLCCVYIDVSKCKWERILKYKLIDKKEERI